MPEGSYATAIRKSGLIGFGPILAAATAMVLVIVIGLGVYGPEPAGSSIPAPETPKPTTPASSQALAAASVIVTDPWRG